MRKLMVYKCLECKNNFESTEKEAKFCCKSCAATYHNKRRTHNIDTRYKISIALKQHHSKGKTAKAIKEYNYKCEKCGDEFKTLKKIRKDRYIHCEKCVRRPSHLQDLSSIDSILKLSKRTVSKILKRMNLGCSCCGWNNCAGDIHHIIPKKKGGTNKHDNLTYLCPNCHRMAHSKLLDPLKMISMAVYVGDKWKAYYGENHIGRVTS